MTESPLFPILVYVYDRNGRYGSPIVINDIKALGKHGTPLIELALKLQTELVMTDSDDMCVLHVKDGAIIFPTRSQCEQSLGGARG